MRRKDRRSWLGGPLAGVLLALAPPQGAQGQSRPGLLLGGGDPAPKSAAHIDPLLPTGARVQREPRPTGLDTVYCGLRQPVCVHGAVAHRKLLEGYLGALEDASALLVGALGLPAPLPDGGGPTPGLDLYLLPGMVTELSVTADARWQATDRSSGFCRARPSRSELGRQATLCVAEALLLGLNAAETPHLRRAVAAYLWQTIGGSSNADLARVEEWQANPQLSALGRDLQPESAGAAALLRYVDRRLGVGRPGALPLALFQLSRSDTPAGKPRWNNEPDGVDVLRQAFESTESFYDFLLNFAVARAFLGSRDNGRNDPASLWMGDAGRVRFEWNVQASSLPRHLAPRRPIEPFGSAYLWLELDRVTLGGTLAFRASWEEPAEFRWTLVAVDAAGSPIKRFDLPYVQQARSVERTLVEYGDAVGFLIVGTSVGGVDLAHPFDPDHEPFEPHGFTVYLAEI